MEEFTDGCTLSASMAALAKNGRNDSLTPSRVSKSPFAFDRSRAILVTSASTTVVSWALTCRDSTIRRAMTARRRDSFSVRPRTDGWGVAGRDGGWAGAEAAGAAAGGGDRESGVEGERGKLG